jgi:hypothetical protein
MIDHRKEHKSGLIRVLAGISLEGLKKIMITSNDDACTQSELSGVTAKSTCSVTPCSFVKKPYASIFRVEEKGR